MIQCQFTYNVSDLKGGAVYCTNSSSGLIQDCDFIGNNSLNGGAIALNISSSPSIDGCFFDDNSANDGGAIGTFNSCAPTISNCTFVHNSAADGGSLHFEFSSDATVYQCILAFGTTGNVMGCGASTPEIYHNLIWSNGGGDILCGNSHDNIYQNPEFCGTTNQGPYTLQSDSPAAAANNTYGVLMGSSPVDCGESAAAGSSWSEIKLRY
jgi:predicted outer membrane repeat protein